MYRSYLKSQVFENQNPFMWCSKEINGAKIVASDSIGDYSITDCKEPENEEQVIWFKSDNLIRIRHLSAHPT